VENISFRSLIMSPPKEGCRSPQARSTHSAATVAVDCKYQATVEAIRLIVAVSTTSCRFQARFRSACALAVGGANLDSKVAGT
ncbi:hypothetical protein KAW64_06965, partial [bacterium]|nr:hypothetical protein [bacterium]